MGIGQLFPLIIGIIFALWLIVTVLNQLNLDRFKKLMRLDAFHLIPIWTFFAPNPGTSDYYLLFRDRLVNGSLTYWREIVLGAKAPWLRAFWNPERRRSKALLDLATALIQLTQGYEKAQVTASIPYLLLLELVEAQDRTPLADARQFLIMIRNPSAGTTAAAFLSQFHRVC